MRRRSSNSTTLRKRAFERDAGICAHCGADCEKTKRVYWSILDFDAQVFYASALGITDEGRTFWDADHILEVADNGSDSLRNIQTLCVRCHAVKTGTFLAKRLAVPDYARCQFGCGDIVHIDRLLAEVRDHEVKYFPTDGRMKYYGPAEGWESFASEFSHPLRHHDAAIVALISQIRAPHYESAAIH